MVKSKPAGGLKGLIQRTGQFFFASGTYAWRIGYTVGYELGGKVAFAVATTSMVVFMPLIFEISREALMIETERSQIKDLKTKGYSDRQLQEMGFCDVALHTPAVAAAALRWTGLTVTAESILPEISTVGFPPQIVPSLASYEGLTIPVRLVVHDRCMSYDTMRSISPVVKFGLSVIGTPRQIRRLPFLSSTMETHYEPPVWASRPPAEESTWKIVEIKGGVVMAEYALHERPWTLFGRAPSPTVHITTAHASCSRIHARIAFEVRRSISHQSTSSTFISPWQTIPWLRDLASTHGTTVNNRRLPLESIGKDEDNFDTSDPMKAGSRGVILFPGDIIRFGASTRMYALEGPACYDRVGLVSPITDDGKTAFVTSSDAKTNPLNPDHQSIGYELTKTEMIDNDESDNYPDLESFLAAHPLSPDSQHHTTYNKVQALRYKLENLVTESDRIRRKGVEGLTTGQENQLARNDSRITELTEQIRDREQDLYQKLTQKTSASFRQRQKKRNTNGAENDDDVDDFYDQTKGEEDQNRMTSHIETEKSLEVQLESLEKRLLEINSVIETHQAKKSVLEHQIHRLKKAGEEEEIFFAQNDADLVCDILHKSESDKRVVINDMTEAKRLLRLANPHWIEKASFNPAKKSEESNDCFAMPPPPPPMLNVTQSKYFTKITVVDQTDEGMPPPPVRTTNTSTPMVASQSDFDHSKRVNDRKRPLSSTVTGSINSIETSGRNTATYNRAISVDADGASRSTLGALFGVPSKGTRVRSEVNQSHEARALSAELKDFVTPKNSKSHSTMAPTFLSTDDTSETKHDGWRVPCDQDGSGTTKLNTKFAGRY